MATPISYNLDILGGVQFERLVQLVLQAELGLGVEAWGGSADHGKDAYCKSELNFPNRHATNPGPFVFQAKFISGANAAGAQFASDLFAAVTKEAKLIENRLRTKQWKMPQQYGLFTNAPVTAAQRNKVLAQLQTVLPRSEITIHGATSICNLLDLNISVARTFPQILSLRDLTELLRKVVRNASIQRSEAVIKEAEALTKVFVPTNAYDQAWRVLTKHNFVVLEGPPEMGKTAIAWMIAAVHLTQKWESIDCDSPKDLFEDFEPSKKQVFVADDAFGTTEYEPTRGNEWGRHLHKVLPKLNSTHRLVLTSRMHILKKALQEMSLQGKAVAFPKPGEVIVNASRLDRGERALILYRHARAAGLEQAAKAIVRRNAEAVIENGHFTPERIKRFVIEELPSLSRRLVDGKISEDDVSNEIGRAIEHPTERMEKALSKLDASQKWVLRALLDCQRYPVFGDLEIAYRRFSEMNKPIRDEVQLLEEGFLQESTELGFRSIGWIHPSYRDLVINELEKDEAAAKHFLEHCGLVGIDLALSVAGGAMGTRKFPLMAGPQSWEILRRRLLRMIREDQGDSISSLLRTLRTAISSAGDAPDALDQLAPILNDCCLEAKSQLDELNTPINADDLREFYDLTMQLSPPPPMPSVHKSLQDVESKIAATIKSSEEDGKALDGSVVADWATTVSVIARSDRRLLIQLGFPTAYSSRIEKLCSLVRKEIKDNPSIDDKDDFNSEFSRMTDLPEALRELVGLIPNLDVRLQATSKETEKWIKRLQSELSAHYRDSESISENGDDSSWEHKLDLERLFADL
jgi:hypothetical protein